MSNSIIFLKGSRRLRPSWQGMLIGIIFGFIPFLASAETTAEAILRLHNQARAEAGSPALCLNQQLMTATKNHCDDMVSNNFFSHTGSDGSSAGTRIARTGYSFNAWGENIAWGQTTADEVMGDWLSSPGHRANILNPNFKEMGVAKCGSQYQPYWVVDFAAPASGRTNCITSTAGTTGTGTTGSTGTGTAGTTTPTGAQTDPGLATYNMCKALPTGWQLVDPVKGQYYIWWKDNGVTPPVSRCYRYDAPTDRMYVLLKNTAGKWRWTLIP